MGRATKRVWNTVTNSMLGALVLIVLTPGAARADAEPDYRRLTLTVNTPYLLAGLVQVNAEWAARSNWSVAVRGGLGESDLSGEPLTIAEVGGRSSYYVLGNASRGVELGFDARAVSYEGGGMLMGLGDGVAAGPVIGYKRSFRRGFTLAAQLGAQVPLMGRSDGNVLPYLALSVGWAFLPTGTSHAAPIAHAHKPAPVAPRKPASANPFDHHRGVTFGLSLAGGTAAIDGCDDCDLEAGIAAAGYLGWFVHPRVAIAIDSTAIVTLFAPSSGFGSFGFGFTGPAVHYWPHPSVALKLGLGVTQLTSVGIGSTGTGDDIGGGFSAGASYLVHRDDGFGIDVQVRATHGSFEGNGELSAVDSFVALVGVTWF